MKSMARKTILSELPNGRPEAVLSVSCRTARPQQIAGFIGPIDSEVMRVVSVGKSGNVTRTVQVVFVKDANQLKSWKEF